MLDFLDKNFKWIALVTICILILLMMQQCSVNKELQESNDLLTQSNSILSGNIKVLKDTVKFWKDDNGRHLSSISVLTANESLLKSQYQDVYQKYREIAGKSAEDSRMIAYLNGKINFKDREISDLKTQLAGVDKGSRILNDSTVLIDIGKTYDSLNAYKVSGTIVTSIRENRIKAGKIDLTTAVDMGIELAINRDKETSIARITTSTAFPAKVVVRGLTQIENEINKKIDSYLGIGLFGGYGATLQKQPMLTPMLGIGVYYAPSWSTIKFYKK